MTTQEIAHRFFYDLDQRSEYSGVTTHFRKAFHFEKNIIGIYYSYSTEIAFTRLDKNKKEALIISDFNYSHSTCKHQRELHSACPHYNIYTVPYVEGFDMDKIFTKKLKEIIDTDPSEFRQKPNRDKVKKLVYQFDKYEENVEHLKDASKIRKSPILLRTLEIIDSNLKDIKNYAIEYEELKKKEEQRKIKAEIRKNKEDIKLAETILKTYTSNDYDKIKFLFESMYLIDLKQNERNALKTYKSIMQKGADGKKLALVWETDKGQVTTSLYVTVESEDVKRLLKIWLHKERLLGESIDGYTFVENNNDYVKVGCHIIPVWNVKALCQHFNIE